MVNEINQYESIQNNWSEGFFIIYTKNIKELTEQNDNKFKDNQIYQSIDNIVDDITHSNIEKQPSKVKKGFIKVASRVGSLAKGGLAGSIVGAGIGYMNGDVQEGAIIGAEYGLILDFSKQILVQGMFEGIVKPIYKKFKKSVHKKSPKDAREISAVERLMHEIILENPRLAAEATAIYQIHTYDNHKSIKSKIGDSIAGGLFYMASALPYNVLSDENIKLKIAFGIGAVERIINNVYQNIKLSINNTTPENKKVREIISTLNKEERFQLIGGLVNRWHGPKQYETESKPTKVYAI